MNQAELASAVGGDQISVSRIENGLPSDLTDGKIDKLFREVGLEGADVQASFVKWWRDNG